MADTAWDIAANSNLKPTNQNTAGSTAIGGSGKRAYSTDATANQTAASSMGAGSTDASEAGELFCFWCVVKDSELRLFSSPFRRLKGELIG